MPLDPTQEAALNQAILDADAILTTKQQALTDSEARQSAVDSAQATSDGANSAASASAAAFSPVREDYGQYMIGTTPYDTTDDGNRHATFKTAGDLMQSTALAAASAATALSTAQGANTAPNVADATAARDAQKVLVDAANAALETYIAANE